MAIFGYPSCIPRRCLIYLRASSWFWWAAIPVRAIRRVGYLLDEIRLHGENAELRDEVTELARKYGIVTPYTAYLIMEDEQRRRVPLPMRSLPQLREDGAARQE